MKISIRRGVFETNSSSTHAIMIQKRPSSGRVENPERWTLEEGFKQIEGMGGKIIRRYSWPNYQLDLCGIPEDLMSFYRTEEAYNTWGMKLLYAIASFKGDSFLWNALLSYLKSKDIYDLYMKTRYSVAEPEGESMGGIDHESTDALGLIFASGLSFEDYLERKDVYVMIDNEG